MDTAPFVLPGVTSIQSYADAALKEVQDVNAKLAGAQTLGNVEIVVAVAAVALLLLRDSVRHRRK